MAFNVDVDGSEAVLYSHPKLREVEHENLLLRLEACRNRRLIAAIEHKNAFEAKQAKIAAKLYEQWLKQDERNRAKLLKCEELCREIDNGILKQIELGHKLELSE